MTLNSCNKDLDKDTKWTCGGCLQGTGIEHKEQGTRHTVQVSILALLHFFFFLTKSNVLGIIKFANHNHIYLLRKQCTRIVLFFLFNGFPVQQTIVFPNVKLILNWG